MAVPGTQKLNEDITEKSETDCEKSVIEQN